MPAYRLNCIMRSDKNWKVQFPVTVEDKHPDLCKQKLEQKYPFHTMLSIHIEDISPASRRWDSTQPTANKNRVQDQSSQVIDLDRTWRKELAK